MAFLQRNAAVKSVSLEQMLRDYNQAASGMLAAHTAYTYVPWVRNAVDKIANGVSGLPFGFYREGVRVAGDDNYEGELALDFEIDVRDLLNALTADLMLYGKGHWQLVENSYGYKRVVRLAARRVMYDRDSADMVYQFRYLRGAHTVTASRWSSMANSGLPYVWLPNRQDEDGNGESPTVAALKAASLLDAISDYGKSFFANGGSGPTIVEFQDYQLSTEEEKTRVKSWLNRFWKAFTPLATGQNVKVHHVGSSIKDIEMPELSKEKREDVAAAYQIPAGMLFSNASNFATAQIDQLNFADQVLIPTGGLIFNALNKRGLADYGIEIRIEPHRMDVYQQAELQRSRAYVPFVDRGIVGINEVRSAMYMAPRDSVEGDVFFSPPGERVPAPEGNVSVQQAGRTAVSEDPAVRSMKAQGDVRAFAYVPLSNNADVLRVVQRLRKTLTNPLIDWQTAPTYHITLCFAPEGVSSEIVNAVSRDVQARNLAVTVSGMGIFENDNERALYLAVQKTPELAMLQSELYTAFAARGIALSDYSNPDQYTPHITLAYLPPSLEVALGEPVQFTATADSYILGRDNYEPEVIVRARTILNDELKLWQRKALKRFDEGKLEKAFEFDSESLSAGIKAAIRGGLRAARRREDVVAVFAGAEGFAHYG